MDSAFRFANRSERGWLATLVYARATVLAGTKFARPALVEDIISTIRFAPAPRAALDHVGNVVIHVRQKS